MNKTLKQFKYFWIALFIIGGFLLSPSSRAQVNQSLNFTGKVTETDGSELADGVYDFSFALYSTPTGGASIWHETLNATTSFSAIIASGVASANTIVYTYTGASATTSLRVGQYLSNSAGLAVPIADFDTGANTITVVGTDIWSDATVINNRPFVEGGVIDVSLGAVTDFSGVDFNQTLYLEVIFNGETMRPRQAIDSVAQAFNADTLDGFRSSDFANLADNSTVTGEWTFDNIVGVASNSAQTLLTVNQNGSGDIVDFQLGGATALAVLNDGRVQIGDYYFPSSHGSAGYVLKTNAMGDLYWDVDFAGSGGGSGYWATSTDNSFVFQSDVGQLIVLGNNATSAPVTAQLEVDGLSWFDDIGVSNQQSLRLYNTDSSNYMAIRATGTLSSDYTLTLPGDVGVSGEAMITDGNGNLTWGNPSSAGTVNTASLTGQIPFYATVSDVLTATSAIFIDPNNSYIGIGTTAPTNLLSVNGTADFDKLCFGGSCISSWGSAGSIDGSGTAGYVTFWQDADTLDAEQYLSVARGGLAQDFSGSTGFVYFDAGVAKASSSISITRTDLAANSGINLNGSLLTLDNTGNWIGTLDGLNGSDIFTLADWFATTTAPQLTTLLNLTSVGNISTGAWQADPIGVSYGGTAKSSWTQYAIPYMTDASTFGEIAIGSSTYVLSVNASGNGYEWIEASSTGVVLTQEQVDDYVDALINDLDSTHTRINITYDDANNAMDFVVDDNLADYDNSNSQFFSTTTDTLAVDYGGTGRASWTQYSIPYMASSNTYGEIDIGTSTYILAVNANGDGYEWIEASSTGVVLTQEQVDDYTDALLNDPDSVHTRITVTYDDANDAMDFVVDDNLADYNNSNSQFFSTTTDTLAADFGGTGVDSSAWTGFAYVDAGTWRASNTIAANRLDSVVMLAGEGNALLTNTANYIISADLSASLPLSYNSSSGSFSISQADSGTDGYLSSGDWTTFNAKQAALTLGNLTESSSTLLTITGGTGATVGDVTIEVDDDLSNYDNTTTAFIARTGISATSPVAYDSNTGVISLGLIGVANGGTGSTTAAGARENLGLDNIYDYAINSTATSGWVWMSDGAGRGEWIASTTLMAAASGDNVSKFIGTTTATFDGSFATSTLVGYMAANDICNAEFTGAHFCRTYDILVTVEQDDISTWAGSAWIAEGPPGYTSNSNDCQGWTSNNGSHMGAFWAFDANGGMGWLTNCSVSKPIACCIR